MNGDKQKQETNTNNKTICIYTSCRHLTNFQDKRELSVQKDEQAQSSPTLVDSTRDCNYTAQYFERVKVK